MQNERIVLKAFVVFEVFQHLSPPFRGSIASSEKTAGLCRIQPMRQTAEFYAKHEGIRSYLARVGIIGESACWRMSWSLTFTPVSLRSLFHAVLMLVTGLSGSYFR